MNLKTDFSRVPSHAERIARRELEAAQRDGIVAWPCWREDCVCSNRRKYGEGMPETCDMCGSPMTKKPRKS